MRVYNLMSHLIFQKFCQFYLLVSPSLIDLIIGTPPHTAASYSKFTLFFSAILESKLPCLAIKALLAVITCFFLFKELNTRSFAGPSEFPISSTTISISLLLKISL